MTQRKEQLTLGIFLLTMLLFFTACKEKPDIDKPNTASYDVYICGNETNSAGKTVALYWKNGEEIRLTDGADNAQALTIYVAGNDVYVAGYEANSAGKTLAKYWKNGKEVLLTDGTTDYFLIAASNSIHVANGDVHIAGYGLNETFLKLVPCYWKNGKNETPRFVEEGETAEALMYDVFVSDGDVYLVGVIHKDDKNFPTYWKNGKAIRFSLQEPAILLESYSLYVSNGDLYIAGSEEFVPKYWKNGKESILGSKVSLTTSIFVSDGDVYVSGKETTGTSILNTTTAVYWKNGFSVTLSNGKYSAGAADISVSGKDVFVAGYETNSAGKTSAMYWKNGEAVSLTDGAHNARAEGIFVVKKE